MSELVAGKELAQVEGAALRAEVESVTKQLEEAKSRRERTEAKSREIAALLDQNLFRNQDVEQKIAAKSAALTEISESLVLNKKSLESIELAIPTRTALLKELENSEAKTAASLSTLKKMLDDLEEKTALTLAEVSKLELERIEVLKAAALATRLRQQEEQALVESRQRISLESAEQEENHAALMKTMAAEADAGIARIKGEVSAVRGVAAKSIMKARGRIAVARQKALTAAGLISENVVQEAKKKAEGLISEGETEKKQCLLDAREIVKNAVADASAVLTKTKEEKREAEASIVSLRRAAAASIVRSRKKAEKLKTELSHKAETSAEAMRLNAEASAKAVLAKAEVESQRILILAAKDAGKLLSEAKSHGENLVKESADKGALLQRVSAEDVENKRQQAIAEGKVLLARIEQDIAGDVSAARDKRKLAEDNFAAAKIVAEKLITEATDESRSIVDSANKQAELLTGRVQREYDDRIATADRLSAQLLAEAEAKAAVITQSVQQDYDAKLSEAELTYTARLTEAQNITRQLQLDADVKIKTMYDEMNQASATAQEESKKIRSAATMEAEITNNDARARAAIVVEAVENDRKVHAAELEKMFAKSQAQLHADLQKKKDDAESILKEWLSSEHRKAKETRKQRALDASSIVRRMVEARATKSVVNPGNPFELASIADEIEQAVKSILLDENITDKDKLAKFMSVDGGAKLKRMMYRRKMYQMSAIAVLVGVLIASIGFALYNKVKSSKDSPDSGELYVSKVMNKKNVVRMYLEQQTTGYKHSYVENILLTEDYADHEVNRKYQDRWIVDLNKFLTRELDVSDKVLVKIVPLEANLVRRLEKLARKMTAANEKETRKEMVRIERDVTDEMSGLLGGDKKLREFFKFKKKFYETYAGK